MCGCTGPGTMIGRRGRAGLRRMSLHLARNRSVSLIKQRIPSRSVRSHPRRKKQRRAEGGAPEFHSPWVGESRWMAVTRPLEIAAESSFSVGGKAESRRGLRMYGLEPAPFTNCAHLCFSGLLAGLPGKCSLFCLDLPQSADFGCTGYPV
jgi:hypothetical protein